MRSEPQSVLCCVTENIRKDRCGGAALITAKADAYDTAFTCLLYLIRAHGSCEIGNPRALFRTEVPHGIEDPEHAHTEIARTGEAPAFHPSEERREVLSAPVDDTHAHIHFRVQHVLCGELLHHAIRDEFIILWRAHAFGHGLERHQEPGEIFIVIETIDGRFIEE